MLQRSLTACAPAPELASAGAWHPMGRTLGVYNCEMRQDVGACIGGRDQSSLEPQTLPVVRRRALCRACADVLGLRMQDVAVQCGVTYNHLILVLDGERRGSARLEAALRGMMLAAKPLLLDALHELR